MPMVRKTQMIDMPNLVYSRIARIAPHKKTLEYSRYIRYGGIIRRISERYKDRQDSELSEFGKTSRDWASLIMHVRNEGMKRDYRMTNNMVIDITYTSKLINHWRKKNKQIQYRHVINDFAVYGYYHEVLAMEAPSEWDLALKRIWSMADLDLLDETSIKRVEKQALAKIQIFEKDIGIFGLETLKEMINVSRSGYTLEAVKPDIPEPLLELARSKLAIMEAPQ